MAENLFSRGILCVCSENTVRSVMLETLLAKELQVPVASAGVMPAVFCDMMVEQFLRNKGYDTPPHDPRALDDIDASSFDLWIALSRKAYETLRDIPVRPELEYWDIPEPLPLGEASRDMLDMRLEDIWKELRIHASNRFRMKAL